LALVGGVLVVAAIYGWLMEPSTDPAAGHHADHPEPSEPSGDASTEPSELSGEAVPTEEAALVD
jgi:hypothetical protein